MGRVEEKGEDEERRGRGEGKSTHKQKGSKSEGKTVRWQRNKSRREEENERAWSVGGVRWAG